jgi:DNA-binding transcriptional LysR family regulator
MKKTYPSLARLRALETVCALGGFTAAGDALLLTQSAVSNQVRQLEDEVGAMLIERIGKSVRPTMEGEKLIACAQRIFRDLDDTFQELSVLRGSVSGEIVIAAGGTANTYLLPGLLTQISQTYPGLSIRVLTGNTEELVQQLLEMTVDILIGTPPISHPKLAQEPFYDDKFVCIVPMAESSVPKFIRPKDLVGKQLILYEKAGYSRIFQDVWLSAGNDYEFKIHEIGSAEAQKTFVRAGFGWSLISEMAVVEDERRGLLRVVHLKPKLIRPIITVWRKDREDIPAIAAVRKIFGDFARRKVDVRDLL